MKYPISVWLDYFNELPVEDAIVRLSRAGFTHGELSIVALLLVQNATVILIITWSVLFALAIAVAVVGHILLKKNTQRLFERINA